MSILLEHAAAFHINLFLYFWRVSANWWLNSDVAQVVDVRLSTVT